MNRKNMPAPMMMPKPIPKTIRPKTVSPGKWMKVDGRSVQASVRCLLAQLSVVTEGMDVRSLRRVAMVLQGCALWMLSHSTIASEGVPQVSQSAGLSDLQSEIHRRAVALPGAAVVWVVDGKVQPMLVHGFQSLDDIRPVTEETLFQLASLSKSFAAAAVSVAVAQGQLRWGMPVRQLLPTVRWSDSEFGSKLRVFHLANQSTGLLPHAFTNLVEDRVSYSRMVSRLNEVPFICAPGSCYSYQNVAFSLVGDVIRAGTGVGFSDYVQRHLFARLKMPTASLGAAALVDGRMASAHVFFDDRWRPVEHSKRYYKVLPAAGVNASISDMKRWLLAQLGLIDGFTKEQLDTLQNRYIVSDRDGGHYPEDARIQQVGYGLGWRTFSFSGLSGFAHHGGYVRGMRSEMVFHRRLRSGMVFLTNSEPSKLNEISLFFAGWLAAREKF